MVMGMGMVLVPRRELLVPTVYLEGCSLPAWRAESSALGQALLPWADWKWPWDSWEPLSPQGRSVTSTGSVG